MINRRILILVGVVTLGVIGYIFVLGIVSFVNSVDVGVLVENSSQTTIKLGEAIIEKSNNSKPVHMRVPMNSTIDVSYVGIGEYESSHRSITIETTPQNITIKPYFSEAKLSTLLKREIEPITAVMSEYNQDVIKQYTLKNIQLHHYGEWASAQLDWVGDSNNENSDTLYVILQKKDSKWNIIGKPNIIFYKDRYPEVPEDVLEKINTYAISS